MDPSPVATEAVRRAVRAALVAEGGGSPVPVSLAGTASEDFLAGVRRQRVTEILAQHAGAIGLPDPLSRALDQTRQAAGLRSLAQVRCLLEVQRVLDDAGVSTLHFKGPALAVQTTGDFTSRGAGDVDILVAPADVARTVAALGRVGWAMRPGPPSDVDSWGWRYLMSVAYELALDGPLGTVDLHWRLDPTRAALPAFEQMWSRRQGVVVGPARVETLSLPDAFRHSCHHAAKDEWRFLRSLVDVHRLARHGAGGSPSSPVMTRTLAVVDGLLGLPTTTPDPGRRASRWAVERAVAAQDQVGLRGDPGSQTLRSARYRLASGHGGADLSRTLAAVVLPPVTLAGIEEPSAAGALRRAVPRRVVHVVRRAAGSFVSNSG